ncbi:MAG: hypothetical protein LIP23_08080 [Planctomycetes bacterium]|nr:hypothetical protein [Planctomycetota bacterium]
MRKVTGEPYSLYAVKEQSLKQLLRILIVITVATQAAVPALAAEDALEMLTRRDIVRTGRLTLDYRDVPLQQVLDDMESYRPGVNLEVKAATRAEEKALLAGPVDLGPLRNVGWDTALGYIADRLDLVLDKAQLGDGLVYLVKTPRFTDTFNGVRLGEAVRELARRGNANVVFAPNVDTDARVYLSFTDVPWREALDSVLASHNYAVIEEGEGRILRIAGSAEAATRLVTRSRPLRYLRPDGSRYQPLLIGGGTMEIAERSSPDGENAEGSLLAALEQLRTVNGTVTYEARTNTLILRDTPASMEEMLRLVEKLDQPPLQILIETRLISATDTPSLRLGVEWDGDGGLYWTGENDAGSEQSSANRAEPCSVCGKPHPWLKSRFSRRTGSVATPCRTGKIAGDKLDELLRAGSRSERIKMVQAPQIVVLDNEEASVFIGNLRWRTGLGDAANFEPIQALASGVQLMVAPQICAGSDEIILELIHRQTDNPSYRTSLGATSQQQQASAGTRAVHTKLMLRSGETGVVAGLFRRLDADAAAVPADLPAEAKAASDAIAVTSDIMLLVTASIVPPSYDNGVDADVEAYKTALAASL